MLTLHCGRSSKLAAIAMMAGFLVCQQTLFAARPVVRVSTPPLGNCPDGACYARPGKYGYYETRWKKWPGSDAAEATPAIATPEEIAPPSPEMTPRPTRQPSKPPSVTVPEDDEDSLLPSGPDDLLPGLQGRPQSNPLMQGEDDDDLPSLSTPDADDDMSSLAPRHDMAADERSAVGNPLRGDENPITKKSGSLRASKTARNEPKSILKERGLVAGASKVRRASAIENLDSSTPFEDRRDVRSANMGDGDETSSQIDSVSRLPLPDNESEEVVSAMQWEDAEWPELANWPPADDRESAATRSSDNGDETKDADVETPSTGDDKQLHLDPEDEERQKLIDEGYEFSASDSGAAPLTATALGKAGGDTEIAADGEPTPPVGDVTKSSRRSRAATRPAIDEPRRVVVSERESTPLRAEKERRPNRNDSNRSALNPLRGGKPRTDAAVKPASFNREDDPLGAWLETSNAAENPLRSR